MPGKGKPDGQNRGAGAYSQSGEKLRRPVAGEYEPDTADRKGSGPYSRSEIPMDRKSDPNDPANYDDYC
jgi:hypothetical protein